MRAVFADSHYWIALLNRRDEHHGIAKKVEASLEPDTQIVTTEMVLVEVLNAFAKRELGILRGKAVQFVLVLRDHPSTDIIPQTSEQFQSSLDVYRRYVDKRWGLTDCASYLTMKAGDITEALTNDHHFAQMGFRALLRE